MRITDPSQLDHVAPQHRARLERELGLSAAQAGKMMRPEEEAGRRLIRWLDELKLVTAWGDITVGDYFAHNANGGARTRTEGAILKGQGVRKGWPDYTLYIPTDRWHGAVLELKAEDGAKPDDDQLAILVRLQVIGYKPIVAWGFDDAQKQLTGYLAEFVGSNRIPRSKGA